MDLIKNVGQHQVYDHSSYGLEGWFLCFWYGAMLAKKKISNQCAENVVGKVTFCAATTHTYNVSNKQKIKWME